MIELFIPVIWICINGNCEFMQSEGYFKSEAKCLANLEQEKQHMRDLVREARQNKIESKIEVLEGTCVDVQINTTERTV